MVGRNKRASLNYIKERVWNKLQGWKEQLLSQVGREVLLKAMVQAIPTFAMSCFRLPISLFHEIEMSIRKFWWGQQGEQRKIHWKSWEVLCQPKSLGGLGFKDLQKFNEAILAKHVWRLLSDQSSLFYHVIKEKYFSQGSILDATASSGSYAWKSILAQSVVSDGLLWRVGDSLSIRVYRDNWIPGVFPTKAVLPRAGFSKDLRVAELINPDTGWWDIQKIEQMFLPFEVQKIKEVPLCVTRQEDCLIWPRSRDSKYSGKTIKNLYSRYLNSVVA